MGKKKSSQANKKKKFWKPPMNDAEKLFTKGGKDNIRYLDQSDPNTNKI